MTLPRGATAPVGIREGGQAGMKENGKLSFSL